MDFRTLIGQIPTAVHHCVWEHDMRAQVIQWKTQQERQQAWGQRWNPWWDAVWKRETFLSFLLRVSALWVRPAGRQCCSHGCGVLIRRPEMPGSALPCEGVLENRSTKGSQAAVSDHVSMHISIFWGLLMRHTFLMFYSCTWH